MITLERMDGVYPVIKCPVGIPYVPVIHPHKHGMLIMASYGPLFTLSRVADGSSCDDVVNDPSYLISDINEVYRLSFGELKVIPVKFDDKVFLITYEDFETYLEEYIPDTVRVAHNQLAPHLILVEERKLVD